MKPQQVVLMVAVMLLLVASAAMARASDFDWVQDFNIRAEADPSGFRTQLAARFKIGEVQIDALLGNVERPADAFLILTLGEMSHRETGYVIEQYKAGKGQGWGALAKSLGIAPGSPEFHALKRGNDFYDEPGGEKGKKNMDQGKEKDKGQSKVKGKDR